MASSNLTKSPSELVTTADLIGAAFERVGVSTKSSGMSQTVLYTPTDADLLSGVVTKALVDAATRVDRATMEASDLIIVSLIVLLLCLQILWKPSLLLGGCCVKYIVGT